VTYPPVGDVISVKASAGFADMSSAHAFGIRIPAGGASTPTTLMWTYPATRIDEMRAHVKRADRELRAALAQRFADNAATWGVSDLLVVSDEPELHVVVVVQSHDLDKELDMRAFFRRLAVDLGDGSLGDLDVVSEDEAPEYADATSILR
jgi:hypothetical protein